MLKSYILKTRVLGEDPLEVLILSGRPFVNRIPPCPNWASLVTQMAKKLPSMQETLGQENPLEKEIAALSRILAWRMPWTEDHGGLQFMGSPRVRHNFFSLPVQIHGHFHAQDGPPTPVGAERPLGVAGTGMCVPVSSQGPLLWFISDSGRGGEPPCVTVCGCCSWVGWGQVSPAILGDNCWFQGGTCPVG